MNDVAAWNSKVPSTQENSSLKRSTGEALRQLFQFWASRRGSRERAKVRYEFLSRTKPRQLSQTSKLQLLSRGSADSTHLKMPIIHNLLLIRLLKQPLSGNTSGLPGTSWNSPARTWWLKMKTETHRPGSHTEPWHRCLCLTSPLQAPHTGYYLPPGSEKTIKTSSETLDFSTIIPFKER